MSLNLIWQTKEGEQTDFEYEYITEILFKNFDITVQFDKNTFKTVKDNSVIIYSEAGQNASPELIHYLNKFVKKKYRFYLLHLSNEGLKHDCWYYAKANYVFRNYYDPEIKLSNVKFIPLGIKSGYLNKENLISNNSDRTLDVAFIGQPKSDRFEMIEEIEKLKSYYLHKTGSWNCPTALSQAESIEIYKKTKYAPSPMGQVHVDSFRSCEALEWGCIPIVKTVDGEDYFKNTFGSHPFGIVNNWNEIGPIITGIEYGKKNNEVYTWYLDFKQNLQLQIQQIIESQSLTNGDRSYKLKDLKFETRSIYNNLKRQLITQIKKLLRLHRS